MNTMRAPCRVALLLAALTQSCNTPPPSPPKKPAAPPAAAGPARSIAVVTVRPAPKVPEQPMPPSRDPAIILGQAKPLPGLEARTPLPLERPPRGLVPPREVLALPLLLVDRAKEAGLDYAWKIPGKPPYNIVQMVGHGVALFDFDQDGWTDILLVGARPQLFRNLHDGRFAPVQSGLELLPELDQGYAGAAVGDYDRDGYPDVYLTAYRGGVLLHNDQGRRLRDVTREAGLGGEKGLWSSGASFADLDRDGQLDLIVGHYIDRYDLKRRLTCQQFDVKYECGPIFYKAAGPKVYRNKDGRFQDVTGAWGLDTSTGRNLGVVTADLDLDGQPEVIFANDLTPGDLYVRKPKEDRFANMGTLSGTAFSTSSGQVRGGMGVDVADFDGDGRLDFVEMAFMWQGANLYRHMGRFLYQDNAHSRGVRLATYNYVSFGSVFFDVDNDGWPDLFITNGHIFGEASRLYQGMSFAQQVLLLYNQQGYFWDVSDKLKGHMTMQIVGRGLAAADYDQDGRVDLLAVDEMGHVQLLHNETGKAGHYLSLRLLTDRGIDAYGASVWAKAGDRVLLLSHHVDGGYLSASEPLVHLGLGAATLVPVVEVLWVSGKREQFGPFPADRRVVLKEGTGRPVLPPERS